MTPIPALIAQTLAAMHPIRELPEVTPDSDLAADLGCDEIDRLCIMCAIDEAYGIELPDAAIAGWQTVRDVAASVEAMGEIG